MEVCKKFDIVVKEKWYEHQLQPVMENKSSKILWDFSVKTDNVIGTRRPDLIVIDKAKKLCQIIDFAVPFDSKVVEKEREKTEKYQDLAREVKKIWNMKVNVIPLVIGALGTSSPLLPKRLKDIGIGQRITELQKTAILYSARILQKVLEI